MLSRKSCVDKSEPVSRRLRPSEEICAVTRSEISIRDCATCYTTPIEKAKLWRRESSFYLWAVNTSDYLTLAFDISHLSLLIATGYYHFQPLQHITSTFNRLPTVPKVELSSKRPKVQSNDKCQILVRLLPDKRRHVQIFIAPVVTGRRHRNVIRMRRVPRRCGHRHGCTTAQ
jgi:hypothetical protein